MKMMDAIVKPTAGPGLELRQVPVPTPGPGEVLIKIHKTAICGTDVHIYDWNKWSAEHVVPPMTIGHEYVGEIAELGEGVVGWTVGQRVSGEGHITCGTCRACKTGNLQWCEHTNSVGVQRDGAFAEYLCIPATNLVAISEDIPEDFVSFFDAFGNATHTALMYDLVGENVIITGAGPIGIIAAGIACHAGARKVFITDLVDFRLDLAKKMGDNIIGVNTKTQNLREVMLQHGVFEGFDVGFEMSGAAPALKQLFSVMKIGGNVSLLGLGNGETNFDFNEIINKGLTIKGIYGRKPDNWFKMIGMVEGGFDLSPVITHHFHYTEFEKGFEAMHSGMAGKVVLDWTTKK